MKLMMTEKKDQAEKIAAVMGYKEGRRCFDGILDGEPIRVVWASGHLVTIKNPDEVVPGLPWDDPTKLLPIPRTFPLKVIEGEPGMHPNAHPITYLNNVKDNIKNGISEFIISTDSDREGEAIGWYVLNYLGYKGPVRRVWLSAGLDAKSIKDAMANIRDPNQTKSWFRAAETRGRSDWAFMFLVRAYTHYASYGKFGKNLGQGSGRERVMSVGRVQTSGLALVVRRDKEIENFVSRDHFKLSGVFGTPDGLGELLAAYSPSYTREMTEQKIDGVHWEPSKKVVAEDEEAPLDTPLFLNKIMVDEFKKRLLLCSKSRVSAYSEGTKKESPPKTYSLTTAQADIVKECGISAGLAQTILEDLYEQGWTSYARTANQELPINLYEPGELYGTLNSLNHLDSINRQVGVAKSIHSGSHNTYRPFVPSVFTKKGMEHHGIIPTHQVMTKQSFDSLTPTKKEDNGKICHTKEQMQAVYLLVAKQYVQALYPAAQYAVQEAEFVVPVVDLLGNAESQFRAKGERLVDAGWRSAFNVNAEKNNSFPKVKDGDLVKLKQVDIKSSKTTPPSRYNEITLNTAFENVGKDVADPALRKRLKDSDGIGTPATRKTIIKTLLARGYIIVKNGVFYSTPKGRDLISSVPAWLSTPETTAIWEDYLVKMCAEKDDNIAIRMRDEFVSKQIGGIEKLISELISTITVDSSEKIQPTSSVVTERMKVIMKKIAEDKNIELPRGALSNPKVAQAFLNQHIKEKTGEKGVVSAPSPAQIKYMESMVAKLTEKGISLVISEQARTNGADCSAFINLCKEKLDKIQPPKSETIKPPTESQISFAKRLMDKLPEGQKAPKDVLTSMTACSKFIQEQTRDWKKK